ncbi:MAG: hypothetical protein U0271_07385 [Polyangiaceae bacterium]
MSRPLVDLEDLAELEEKYATLLALREAHTRGEPPPPDEVLRALAARFPSALRELDRLEVATLRERAAELRAVLDGAREGALEVASWMLAMSVYHRAWRVALGLRANGERLSDVSARLPIDEDFARDVRSPPGGRVDRVVLAAVARWTGLSEDDVAASVGARRRVR